MTTKRAKPETEGCLAGLIGCMIMAAVFVVPTLVMGAIILGVIWITVNWIL